TMRLTDDFLGRRSTHSKERISTSAPSELSMVATRVFRPECFASTCTFLPPREWMNSNSSRMASSIRAATRISRSPGSRSRRRASRPAKGRRGSHLVGLRFRFARNPAIGLYGAVRELLEQRGAVRRGRYPARGVAPKLGTVELLPALLCGFLEGWSAPLLKHF